jgi:hypothetical protein
MKKINIFTSISLLLIIASCNPPVDTDRDPRQVSIILDQLNNAAANADFNKYFELFTEDAVFIGTDATEHWDKKSFMEWAKPRFDKKKTWHFESIDRHIYFNKTLDFAWFDELLKTRMKICRGSGVLVKQGSQWKIQQYVLSMTIPNALTDTVVKIKTDIEDELIKKMDVK